MKSSIERILAAVTLASCAAFCQDLSTTVAGKYQQLQAAISAGNLAQAQTLSSDISRLISAQIRSNLPSPQEMLAQAENALATHQSSDPNTTVYHQYLLPVLALQAGNLDKANTYALALLDTLKGVTKGGTGIYGDAMFEAKTVHGLVAVQNGDVATARQDLLDSISAAQYSSKLSTPGGIRYDLASSLLAKGAGDGVVEFLTQCSAFRPTDQQKYSVWIAAIKGGASPALSGR